MKRTQEMDESSRNRLERLWMTCLVACAALYMGCMMVEMGPRSLVVPIAKPIEVMGLIAGTALFVIGITGALVFTRPEA